MPDFRNAFHEVVERGGEKLTRVHEGDVADLQLHVTLAGKRNDAHVSVYLRPHPRRILGVLLAKELQHKVPVVRRQIVKHKRHEVRPPVVVVVVLAVAAVSVITAIIAAVINVNVGGIAIDSGDGAAANIVIISVATAASVVVVGVAAIATAATDEVMHLLH